MPVPDAARDRPLFEEHTHRLSYDAAAYDPLIAAIGMARPIHSLSRSPYLTQLPHLAGEAQIVLIGDGSRGTYEFYAHRANLTKRLIEEKGFTAVTVEADWPDAFRVNR